MILPRKILYIFLSIITIIFLIGYWALGYGASYYNTVIIDTTTKKATWYFAGEIKSFSDLDKSTTSFEVNDGTITAQRIQIGFSNAPYIDTDGSNNLEFYDVVTGSKTLADLVGSFTYPGWEQHFSTESYRIKISSDLYVVGYGSFTYLYGDGSHLTNISGTGIPGGSANDIQYKTAGGDFGGSSNFTWDGTTVTINGGVETSSNIYTSAYYLGDGSLLSNITGDGVPGGDESQVQYKSGGNFAGDSDFTFDGDTVTLSGLALTTGTVTRLTMVTGTATDLTMITGTATDLTVTTGTIQYQTYSGTMTFKPSADYDDYIQMFTESGIPTLYTEGGSKLRLKTSDGNQGVFEIYKNSSNRFITTVSTISGNVQLYADKPLHIYPSGDTDNYIKIRTTSDDPEIAGIGSEHLKITSESGSINFVDENIITTGLVDNVDVSAIPSTYLTNSSASATYWQTSGWEQYVSESAPNILHSSSTIFSDKVSIGTTTATDVGLRIGDGVDSHSLGTTSDAYIAGRLEVDSTAYIDSYLYLYNGTNYGKISHDGTYLELTASTQGVEIPTHTYITGELQVSTITAVGNNVLISTHAKFTGEVSVDTITINSSTQDIYISTNINVAGSGTFGGYVSGTYIYGDATYMTNVATAAHTHDGDTLQFDGISSNGGDFNFGTSGTVTFKVNGDTNDYLALSTQSNYPQFKIIGDTTLRFKSDGTNTKLRLEEAADSNDYITMDLTHSGGATIETSETLSIKTNGDTDDYFKIITSENNVKLLSEGCYMSLVSSTPSKYIYFGDDIYAGYSGLAHTFYAYQFSPSLYSTSLPPPNNSNPWAGISTSASAPSYIGQIGLIWTGDVNQYRWLFSNYCALAGGSNSPMPIQASKFFVASDTYTYVYQDGSSIGLSTHTIVAGSMTITGSGFSINGVEYIFPSSDGVGNQVLQTDGSGNLTWEVDDGGGASTLQVSVAGTEVSSPTVTLDFAWGFTGTETPAGEANITLDTDTLKADYFVSNPATATLNMNNNAIFGVATIDTGQGANELYDMNQNVLTTSDVDFVEIDISTITTTQNDVIYIASNTQTVGYSSFTSVYSQSYTIADITLEHTEIKNLDGQDQGVKTTDAVTFATVDTGQGANELYAMNQDLLKTSSVTFSSCTITGCSVFHDTATFNQGIFVSTSNKVYLAANDYLLCDGTNLYVYCDGEQKAYFANSAFRWKSEVRPVGTAAYSNGDAANYWNDISYKTLTDRGCLGCFDEGVELQDGTIVSDIEALKAIKKHPTKLTIYGMPMLDYKTFPKVSYKKATIDGEILPRDENDEPYYLDEKGNILPASDGVEMTSMFSIMIGAMKELEQKILEQQEEIEILKSKE